MREHYAQIVPLALALLAGLASPTVGQIYDDESLYPTPYGQEGFFEQDDEDEWYDDEDWSDGYDVRWWETNPYYTDDEWYDPTDWLDNDNWEYGYDRYDAGFAGGNEDDWYYDYYRLGYWTDRSSID